MSAPVDGAVLVMPYPRWRRWVRSLRRRSALAHAAASGTDANDRVYLGYGVVLLVLVYGPVLWAALAQAAAPLGSAVGGRGAFVGLVVVGLGALGLASVLAVAAARAGGPLWVSPPEAAFALSGQFPARAVLWRRAALLAVGAGVLGAAVGSAVAAGALGVAGGTAGDAPGGSPADMAAWALAAALALQAPLAVGVAAQGPRLRRGADAVAAALALLGVLAVGAWLAAPDSLSPAATGPGAGVLVVAGLLGLASVWLVVRVLPAGVDPDATSAAQRRTVAAGQALAGGEASGARGVLGAPRYRGRGRTYVGPLLRRAPLVARDLLGLSRRPLPAAASVVAGLGAALLVLTGLPAAPGGPSGSTLAVVVGTVVLYAASSVWAGGLADMAAQPVPGGLLPGRLWRLVAGHAVVPAAAAHGVWVAAVALGALLPGEFALMSAVGLAAVLVTVLAARCWVAGATTAPVELFTPMSTPAGDAQTLVVGAWYLRGWLVVAGGAWIVQRSAGAGTVAAVTAAALVALCACALAVAGVRRLERA